MKKVINYKVQKDEWEKFKDNAFTKLNSKHKIDGFRQGKAPRNIFEKNFPGQIVMEAADIAIDTEYRRLITEDKIIPIIEPKIDLVKVSDDELEVNFTFILEPEVKLGEYKNLTVKKGTVKVSKDEVNTRIDNLLKEYAELMVKDDGKVEKGDVTIIDFEGFKDGIPFDGGKGENYSLEIGSNTFIPGFEDGLIGMKKGETKSLDLEFPKDYGQADLAGKKVTFKVKVNEIKSKVIPLLNKDFFDDLGMDGITNKEELEKKITEEIKAEKSRAVENKYVDDLLEKAVANSSIDVDDEIVLAEANGMYKDLMDRFAAQGISEEIYLQYSGTTKDKIIDNMKVDALKRLKNSYLLNAIVKAEKIKVTDKEAEKEVKDLAVKYNMTEDEVKKSLGGIDAMKYDMCYKKAVDLMKGETSK